MVFKRDKKGGGWHEPPYTWEEEMGVLPAHERRPDDYLSEFAEAC